MRQILFVDDNEKVLNGLKRQLHGLRGEWNMTFLDGGAKALAFMDSSPVDVIVTDMMMAGMDGADLLSQVIERHPDVVRIVLSGHADRNAALRLVGPAHQYLSKPCEAQELREAIARAFDLRGVLCNEQIMKAATRIKTLPSLPAMYCRLIEELRNEQPSPDTIGEIVSHDLGMTSKILQLVNSAFFGLPQHMSDCREAVAYLGVATVRSLVLSQQLFNQFPAHSVKGFSIVQLMDHCWATGVLARKIAKLEHCEADVQDQCFLAGLLHDIGKLVLASEMPEHYGSLIEEARAQHKPLWEMEQAHFGATHAEAGGYLLGLWGLPRRIVEPIMLHHRLSAEGDGTSFSPALALAAANSFAHDLQQNNPQWPANPMNPGSPDSLGLGEKVSLWRSRCMEDSPANN